MGSVAFIERYQLGKLIKHIRNDEQDIRSRKFSVYSRIATHLISIIERQIESRPPLLTVTSNLKEYIEGITKTIIDKLDKNEQGEEEIRKRLLALREHLLRAVQDYEGFSRQNEAGVAHLENRVRLLMGQLRNAFKKTFSGDDQQNELLDVFDHERHMAASRTT